MLSALDVRAVRLVRSQKSVGDWLGSARSSVIRRPPWGPSEVQQLCLDGVESDARQLIGEQWKEARI
eukprot:1286951-Pyramimonas_sp.AAC.1